MQAEEFHTLAIRVSTDIAEAHALGSAFEPAQGHLDPTLSRLQTSLEEETNGPR